MSRVRRLNSALWHFKAGTPHVHATALVSEDGFLLSRALPARLDEASAAGLTNAMLDLALEAHASLRDEGSPVLIRNAHGYAAALTAGSGTILLSLARSDVDPMAFLPQMRSTATDLKQILESQG